MKRTITETCNELKKSFDYEIKRSTERVEEKRISERACQHIYRSRLETLKREVNEYIIMIENMYKYNFIGDSDEYEKCRIAAKGLLIKINSKISELPEIRH